MYVQELLVSLLTFCNEELPFKKKVQSFSVYMDSYTIVLLLNIFGSDSNIPESSVIMVYKFYPCVTLMLK